MFKKTEIIFVISFAILFKLSFYNIAFFITSGSFVTDLISKHEVFKVGKKRRRTLECADQLNNSAINQEQLIAENEESENKKYFFRNFQFPLLLLFANFRLVVADFFFQNPSGIIYNSVVSTHCISIKKHLSLSILRI